jgi:hypothetical protein
MKTILSFAFYFFFLFLSHAECALSGLFVFPKGNTISQNPVFVLDGFGFSEHTIEGLNKDYPIYLQSGDIKVPLEVREINKGQFELTQAVLVPSEILVAGREYTLRIDHIPAYDNLDRHSGRGTWKVEALLDTTAPVMRNKPKESSKILELYGCGPLSYVVFKCLVDENSEMMVKATVRDIKTGVETAYYVETDGVEIRVGHDMCLGAFKFGPSDRYEVEFEFMDASGNKLAWEGPRIQFRKPVKETGSASE